MSNRALIVPSPLSPLEAIIRSIPSPSGTQIVVHNTALALNPVDSRLLQTPGFHHAFGIKSWPIVPGNDIAGTVHAVGPDSTTFRPGDRVLAFAGISDDQDKGAFQEYTLIEERSVARIPAGLGFAEASTLPSSVLTAAGALRDIGIELPASAGEKSSESGKGAALLIWGGASSVGSALVQLASWSGATVITTASKTHHARLESLGADAVFDYRSSNLVDELRKELSARGLTKFTAAIDAASADMPTTAKVYGELGGGQLATLVPWEMSVQDKSLTPPENVKAFFSGTKSQLKDPKDTAKVFNDLTAGLLETGKLKSHKVQIVPGGLSGISEGLKTLDAGVSGVKLVVEL